VPLLVARQLTARYSVVGQHLPEEVRVEVEGGRRNDGREREVVEVRVVLDRELAIGSPLLRHAVEGELLVRVLGGVVEILLEEAGREMVVVAAAEVEVFAVGGDVGLDCAVALEAANTTRTGAKPERLGWDVAVLTRRRPAARSPSRRPC